MNEKLKQAMHLVHDHTHLVSRCSRNAELIQTKLDDESLIDRCRTIRSCAKESQFIIDDMYKIIKELTK